jgi:hypothetical protein
MHYDIQFSDGGVKSFIRDMLPELGRCQTCRFIVENIAALEAINVPDELPTKAVLYRQKVKTWLSYLLKWSSRYDTRTMVWKYDFLPAPTFDEYAELFTVSVDVDAKRKRAVQACREFHQQFCLSSEDRNAIYRKEGYRPQTEMEQKQYSEMSVYLLTHPIEPALDEYTLLRADLLRMQREFSRALEQYPLVEGSKFDDVIAQGRKCCEKQNTGLLKLVR